MPSDFMCEDMRSARRCDCLVKVTDVSLAERRCLLFLLVWEVVYIHVELSKFAETYSLSPGHSAVA